jgi:hypothetical protein
MGLIRWFNRIFRPWAVPDDAPPEDGPHRCTLPSFANLGDQYRCPECRQRWVWQRTLFSSTPYYRTVAVDPNQPWRGTEKVPAGTNDEYTYRWTREADD